ncbi:Inter-alpha-trypsin inhibitor heavy chain H3 [Holothuria leucospilota]|uniref:Inter-alpha-trypsin inhibitor heavy chain H3 n=1 Tax=Holothuria leucospilota TaxID=206669 RepID=A0A9Q1CK42_HOLLE|nr:Inter-alpha-trypsin inhibitor heavy chain H3 [Holothuria leucospilota]
MIAILSDPSCMSHIYSLLSIVTSSIPRSSHEDGGRRPKVKQQHLSTPAASVMSVNMAMFTVFVVITCILKSTNAMEHLFAGRHENIDNTELFKAPQSRVRRAVSQNAGEGMAGHSCSGCSSRHGPQLPEPSVTSYHIVSTVTARYVSTSAIATLFNEADVSQEVEFTFRLTPEAFISDFVMIVDGVPYKASVREREVAQKAYNQARRRGQSAAQVRQRVQSSAQFSVDLNLARRTSVVFNLTYQELLHRDKGHFTHNIHVTPGQIVEDLRVEVRITEPQGLASVSAAWTPQDRALSPATSFYPPSTQATVLFSPSKSLQARQSRVKGLNGVLTVTYDVIHELNGGDLQICNGYFVHHISPEGLPPAPKEVIFVIDVSGSMWGTKMSQTISAMVSILGEMRPIDRFNIASFSTGVRFWKQKSVPATPPYIRAGQAYVRTLRASGATNIHDAIVAAANQFHSTDEAFPAIIFLTDGRPNTGISQPNALAESVKRVINKRVALFCIGFGNDVDDALLERLAAENQGLYRKVFVDSSAEIQMQGFFREVATPLMYNINIRYLNDAVDTNSLTGGNFISYFEGKELVVAGKVADNFRGNSLDVVVTGKSRNDSLRFRVSESIDQELDPGMVEDFAQRMWAFLTIKDKLARAKRSPSQTEKATLTQEALDLSLKYSFVTPLTSLIVIKPPEIVPTTPLPTTSPQPLLVTPQALLPPTQRGGTQPSSIRGLPATRLPTGLQSRVGGDPHFIIDVPHSNLTICFDVQPEDGTFINLISDPILDIYVNGRIEPVDKDLPPRTSPDQGPRPSMLSSLGIQLGHYKIKVTPDRVLVDFEIVMEWGIPRTVLIGDFNITVHDKHHMTIIVGDAISMQFTLHSDWANHPDHFDFTVANEDEFSDCVHGLLGQFQYKPLHVVNPHHGISVNGHTRGVMDVDGEEKYVFRIKESLDVTYDCWWSQTESYIDGIEEQYIVSGYFSHLKDLINFFE